MNGTARLLFRLGHPLLLAGTVGLWLALGGDDGAMGLAWLARVSVTAARTGLDPNPPKLRDHLLRPFRCPLS